jgi:succinoglycan biosynthesis protein ExoO
VRRGNHAWPLTTFSTKGRSSLRQLRHEIPSEIIRSATRRQIGRESMTVSVIIAAYNVENYVARAIASVRAQTYADWEVIVVDDASTDRTASVVEDLHVQDPRIRLLRHHVNSGPSAARNTGLGAATGDWIAVLDADDTWRPTRLETMLNMAARTAADFVADNQILYDEGLAREVGLARHLPEEWVSITAEKLFESDETMRLGEMKPLIRRSFIDEHAFVYNPALRFGEDLFFYAEILIAGARAILLAEPLYVYTTPFGFVSGQRSGGSRTAKRFDTLVHGIDVLLKKYRGRLSPTLLAAIRANRRRRHAQWVSRELTRLRGERRLVSLVTFMLAHPTQTTKYISNSRTFRRLIGGIRG